MLYMYNAPYPDTYDGVHVVFEKYKFHYEIDTSAKRQGLPGLCNFYFYPVMPCIIPNVLVPIRQCDEIGYGTFDEWPRVSYYWWSFDYTTSLDTMSRMLGTSFVSCRTIKNNSSIHPQTRYPILPNMRIINGYDAISNTACLKLNFNGVIEPIWLGDKGKTTTAEQVEIYLERLPLPF